MDTRIRVALFLPNLEIGGAEKLVLDLLQEFLADENFVFHLVLLGRGGKFAKRAEELRSRSNFRFHEMGLPLTYGLAPALRLNRYLKREGIDLVHSHLYVCDKICFLLKFISPRVKVVCTKHCTMRHRLPTQTINFISQFLFDKLVFIDPVQIEHYRRNSRIFRNFITIANGIPLSEAGPARARDGKLRIVCVASIKPSKGQDVLVDALNILGREGLSFRCDFFGDGSYAAELKERVAPGLDVNFNPARPGISGELNRFDLMVVPSRDREGFCLVLMEGFMARIPVISSDFPVLAERAGRGERAMLFKSEDAADLAEKIRGFVKDPSACSKMVEAAYNYVQDYSIRRTAADYLRLYRQVAGAEAGRRENAGRLSMKKPHYE